MSQSGDLPSRIAALHEDLVRLIPCVPDVPAARASLAALPLAALLGVYVNWAQRLIPPRPRHVVYAPGFWYAPLAMEFGGDVLALSTKIRQGDDLTPYLSAKVHAFGFTTNGRSGHDKDFALNAYDTHHLHFQPAPANGRPRSRSAKGPLLCAVFGRETVEFIMVARTRVLMMAHWTRPL